MKIIIACEIYPPDIGGPATFVKNIIPVLKQAGHQIQVITYADSNDSADGVIRISRKTNMFLRYLKYFLAIRKISQDADLIFAQGPLASGLPAILVKKLTGKKVFIKVVGDVAWERAYNQGKITEAADDFQTKKYSAAIERQKKIRSWTVKNADLIITPSEYLKKLVYGWGVAPNKIKVIYNAISAKRKSQTQEQAKRQLGLEGKIILFVGRLTPWKGLETLIDLLPVWLMVERDLKLVIVGEGPSEKILKLRIKNLKLEDKVRLVGRLDQTSVGDYYQAADIFVLNSAYEGLSHTLLEALSFGLPAVVSNVGGNPEVVKNEINGFLVEYNDQQQILEAVKKIAQNQELAKSFQKANQEVLEKFSVAKMNQDYLATLDSTNY